MKKHYSNSTDGETENFEDQYAKLKIVLDSLDMDVTNETLIYQPGIFSWDHMYLYLGGQPFLNILLYYRYSF